MGDTMNDDDALRAARDLLHKAEAITVLTGAGVSAESGIPTYRDSGGLWRGMSPMELASPEGFARDPIRVWEWYNQRRNALWRIEPNPAHYALAELERRTTKFGLVTQNVDRLHQKAGSRNVIELHGNLCEVRCTECHRIFDRTGVELPDDPRCPECEARLRPNVVWFGEMLPPDAMHTAEEWTRRADVLLVVGTSAVVMPAAGLIFFGRQSGAKVIEVNLADTAATDSVDIALRGRAGEVLPRLIEAEPGS